MAVEPENPGEGNDEVKQPEAAEILVNPENPGEGKDEVKQPNATEAKKGSENQKQ